MTQHAWTKKQKQVARPTICEIASKSLFRIVKRRGPCSQATAWAVCRNASMLSAGRNQLCCVGLRLSDLKSLLELESWPWHVVAHATFFAMCPQRLSHFFYVLIWRKAVDGTHQNFVATYVCHSAEGMRDERTLHAAESQKCRCKTVAARGQALRSTRVRSSLAIRETHGGKSWLTVTSLDAWRCKKTSFVHKSRRRTKWTRRIQKRLTRWIDRARMPSSPLTCLQAQKGAKAGTLAVTDDFCQRIEQT